MLAVSSFNSATFTGPAPTIGTGDFAVGAWVRSTASYGYFLDTRGSATTNAGWMAGLYGGRPLLQLNSGGHCRAGQAHNYIAPGSIADDLWHHVVFSIERHADVTISVDGAEVLREQARFGDADLTGSFLTLGSAIDPAPFFGELRDLEVVDRALNGVDVWNRFVSGSARDNSAGVVAGVG